ncbi:MAG: FMN-binding protein [Gammaproteobacteria bacterium]|jgi:electron transport complex protein RnfG|nr:FMN-binding protein [Gammaproteobacteria bacterium]
MSESQVAPAAPQTPGFRMIRTLGAIAMLSGLLVVLVFQYTKPIIAENQRIAIEKAVFKVVPGASRRVDVMLGENGVAVPGEDSGAGEKVYAAFDDQGNLKGVALASSAQGYQDIVKLLYGYDPECACIRGIKILKMTETPGLGDKIAFDPAFLKNFEALDARLNDAGDALAHKIVAVKAGKKQSAWEVDAISGATISSVAVAKALDRSMQRVAPLIQRYKQELSRVGQ